MFALGNGYAYAVANSTEMIDASAPWDAVYYSGFSFAPPDVFSEVLGADVKVRTNSGLWLTQVHSNSTDSIGYYIISTRSMPGEYRDMTFSVFGKLK